MGDGVFLILGGYAAVAIDMKDHVAIIEAGHSEVRGLAVIAEAKKLIPNKPVNLIQADGYNPQPANATPPNAPARTRSASSTTSSG